MEFNPSKCQMVHVTGSKGPVNKTNYVLHGQVLESVTSARYLGVDIYSNLSKMSKVRERAYNSLVRPHLEYASAVCYIYGKKLLLFSYQQICNPGLHGLQGLHVPEFNCLF